MLFLVADIAATRFILSDGGKKYSVIKLIQDNLLSTKFSFLANFARNKLGYH